MTVKSYQADSIEVLEGLDPVKKRPGMYTDTSRPNHLAQEVIDNSVDEALEGHATEIRVTLRKDGSMSVGDDGRGMPVDIHKKEQVSGVELILPRLHSGAKFNSDNYKFSGGLHGVGISVVNALSEQFEVFVKRDGKLHHMAFKDGKKAKELSVKENVGKRNTGTLINFKPNPQYFDSPKFSVPRLKHLLRAKAVLCPGLKVYFTDETAKEENEKHFEWVYAEGLKDYLSAELQGLELIPDEPFVGQMAGNAEAVDWAVQWLPEGGELTTDTVERRLVGYEIGVEKLTWGSDCQNHEIGFHVEHLEDIFVKSGLTEDQAHRIRYQNAAEIFGFEPPALAAE